MHSSFKFFINKLTLSVQTFLIWLVQDAVSMQGPNIGRGSSQNLQALYKNFISDWIGPALLILIAAVAITLLKNRKFRETIMFVGICIIVSLMIFYGEELFGSGGTITTALENLIKTIS